MINCVCGGIFIKSNWMSANRSDYCNRCGKKLIIDSNEELVLNLPIIPNMIINKGWGCPKCNAIMSPTFPTCFYCKPNEGNHYV